MLWFRTPQKVYFKKGCLPVAMRELKQVLGKQKAFVVTDRFLFQSGTIHCITDQLHELGIAYQIFSDVEPDPTLACAKRGAEEMRAFAPDVIIALGGGAAGVAAAFDQNGLGAIVNSSRGIMCAYQKEADCPAEDFAGAARREAIRMHRFVPHPRFRTYRP